MISNAVVRRYAVADAALFEKIKKFRHVLSAPYNFLKQRFVKYFHDNFYDNLYYHFVNYHFRWNWGVVKGPATRDMPFPTGRSMGMSTC